MVTIPKRPRLVESSVGMERSSTQVLSTSTHPLSPPELRRIQGLEGGLIVHELPED